MSPAKPYDAVRVLIVDGANVVGSRPDGWWRDRAGAARRLHEALLVADTAYDEIVLVLEGAAKGGSAASKDAHIRVAHAARNGDDEIVACTRAAAVAGSTVTVVTADRLLRGRVEALGASTMSPTWLLAQLE